MEKCPHGVYKGHGCGICARQVKPSPASSGYARLEKLWQGEGFNKMPSIRLDWSNDRHHEIVIQGRGNVDDVVDALLSLARLIGNDPNLRA